MSERYTAKEEFAKWEEIVGTVISLARDETEEEDDIDAFMREFLEGIQKIHKLTGEMRDHMIQTLAEELELDDGESY